MEEDKSYKIVGGYHHGRTWEGDIEDFIALDEDTDETLLDLSQNKPLVLDTILLHYYKPQRIKFGRYSGVFYVPPHQTPEDTLKLLGFNRED